MTPPKATPDRKGKICRPKVIDAAAALIMQLEKCPIKHTVHIDSKSNLDSKSIKYKK